VAALNRRGLLASLFAGVATSAIKLPAARRGVGGTLLAPGVAKGLRVGDALTFAGVTDFATGRQKVFRVTAIAADGAVDYV